MRATSLILGAFALASCSNETPAQYAPPPAPTELAPIPVVSAPPPLAVAPAPAPQAFVGVLKTDALVALTDSGAEVPMETARTAIEAQTKDALGCLTGGEKKNGSVWFVARVGTSGALEDLRTPSSDATDEQSKCLTTLMGKTNLGPTAEPLAVSFSFSFKPEGADAPTAQAGVKGPDAPWGTEDATSATGNMWGESVGESFGAGGLGLTGIGESAGGRGEGIGLGSIGTLGHGSGTGTGAGFGNGHGRLGGKHGSAPSVRMGATSVSGRLPPEVIQRIVRQNFGRFRLCYENGLRNDPMLMGRVEVEFTIERDGSADHTGHGKGTNLLDSNVVNCIVRAFSALSFPQPEGGVVKVMYPILFSPGDGPAKPAKPAPRRAFKVGKQKIGDVDPETVANTLKKDQRGIATVVLADAPKQSPFVVFVRSGDSVFAVRRLKANAKGFVATSPSAERISPDNWALRVEGPDSLTSHDLLSELIDK